MTFTDLSNQISPFPASDGGNDVLYQNNSFRPTKLLPIRSNNSGGGGGGGDSGGSSSSPPPQTALTTTDSMEDGGDGGMHVDGIPDSNHSFTKTLEQIGYDSDAYSKEKRKFIHELLVQFQSSIGNKNGEMRDTSTNEPGSGCVNGEKQENEVKEKMDGDDGKSSLEIEEYVRKMVDEVLEKQEEMHRQFMEVIRKHDEDRNAREEEWRNQELVRRNREKEMRDQQNARNLSLISFIESYLGYRILVPQTPLAQPDNQQTQLVQPIQQTPLVQTSQQTPVTPLNQQKPPLMQPNQQTPLIQPNLESPLSIQPNQRKRNHDQQVFSFGSNTKRWPQPEVKALISIRTAVDHKLRCREVKHNSVWEEISEAMAAMGYDRTANKCKEKWENINKYFKKTVAGGRRPKSTKTCPYFNELDLLYKSGSLNPGTPLLLTNGDTPLQLTNGSEGDWNNEGNKVHSTPDTLMPEAAPVQLSN